MFKKRLLIILILSILSGCGGGLDYEEEIVLVDQPKEKYDN
jgi:hypothetical protein